MSEDPERLTGLEAYLCHIMRISDLLDRIDRSVCSICADQTVENAAREMGRRKSAVLLVTRDGHPAGIFEERDVLKGYLLWEGRAFSEVQVGDLMTHPLVLAEPGDDVASVIEKMRGADIRYLPVMEDCRIVGVFSLLDLLEHMLQNLNAELRLLQDYITDLHEAGRD